MGHLHIFLPAPYIHVNLLNYSLQFLRDLKPKGFEKKILKLKT